MAVSDTPKKKAAPKKAAPKKKVEKALGFVTILLHEKEFKQEIKEATAKGVALAIQEMRLPFPKGKAVVKIELEGKVVEKTLLRQEVFKLAGGLSSVEINVALLMRSMI